MKAEIESREERNAVILIKVFVILAVAIWSFIAGLYLGYYYF